LPPGDTPSAGESGFCPGFTGGQIDKITVPLTPAALTGLCLRRLFFLVFPIANSAGIDVIHHRSK